MPGVTFLIALSARSTSAFASISITSKQLSGMTTASGPGTTSGSITDNTLTVLALGQCDSATSSMAALLHGEPSMASNIFMITWQSIGHLQQLYIKLPLVRGYILK
jgi:hypothetical protein